MRAVIAAVVLVLATLCTPAAKAWNCSDPSAERVDIGSTLPAGTTAGDGDGQYYKGSDAANPNDYYVCEVVKPTPPTTPGGNSNATSQSNSQSNSTSSSASNSSATGGKSTSTSGSTATGGNATGGSASAGISNAGNSVSTNTNTASGGAGGSANATGGNQHQSQSNVLSGSGNSTATASGNGVGNGNNSNNYTNTSNTNVPAAAASAYAPPSFSTATCFKGFSGGASAIAGGISFGGGKIDQNCAALEAARQAPNLLTFCKQYIQVKPVKAAGVTLEDCMQKKEVVAVRETASIPVPASPVQPIVVNVQPVVVPAPVVNIIAPAPASSVIVKATSKPRVPRSNNKCVPRECPTAKPTVWDNDKVEALPVSNKG
jgi:hypothetical protein